MEIIRASEIGESARKRISEIFSGGFYQWLQYFSKDVEKLSRAFAHMFIMEAFYVAVVDGELAGIAACTDGKTPPVRLKAGELRRHLGFIKGNIAYMMLKRELENHTYPFPMKSGCGSVEFVATDAAYRGKGVASAVIRHIVAHTEYCAYVLEVADTNTNAVQLYQKLGFKEFLRVPHKHSKHSGINEFIYMEIEKRN